ncbi:MAG: Asp-tRNA(Asn)/Glu-tRNA(Gln) amidotransferase subunit GatA [Alphaproteobacteria bacterium]|nr:Asp-tRNA(Asn)/Glu-tRNA(Gln) amidotransferase subunit GatA [Alphaproteobacteria bacterium]
MTDLVELTMAEALEGLAKKEFTSVELTQAHLDEMAKARDLNAYVIETPELALERAKRSDNRRSKGEKLGLMEGIPVGMKDLYCTKGVRTTACSHILDGFVPPYESTVSLNLENQGSVMLGKTNMDEFAMGTANLTSYYGAVRNPYKDKTNPNKFLIPGGSSGGSAAAVAAGLCMCATGSDTGGSIRTPASFCGIVGMKPTYGRCSRYGMIAFASSLDQAGTMTRTVRDTAIMLESMAGYDPKDSTVVNRPVPCYQKALTGDIKGLKIGIPREYNPDKGLNSDVRHVWEQTAEKLRQAGAEIVDINLPSTQYALPTYYLIAPAEASSNLARYDGVKYGLRVDGKSLDEMYTNTRTAGFGKEVKRRIMIGTCVLLEGYYETCYLKAQKVRRLLCKEFDDAYKKVDVILAPAAPETAFGKDDDSTKDPLKMQLYDVFTVPSSLAGLPAISVPAGYSETTGLPIGLQVIGNKFCEETILRVAGVIESVSGMSIRPLRVGGK